MKVLAAPDSFKESLSAVDVADAMARGVRSTVPAAAVDRCPLGDGGEGTVDALVAATGGEIRRSRVQGPLPGERVDAKWGVLADGRTAVIEMAEAAGLARVPPDRRDPTRTTTYGVGELIRAALDEGVDQILIGIGGSATTDGGAGLAQALGVRFPGVDVPATGGVLDRIPSVDTRGRDRRLETTPVVVACDVTNPLLGADGAASVYGPQKGATPTQVRTLDEGLRRLSTAVPWADPSSPGAGAAGGLGFGLVAFCGARLARGIDRVLDAVGFARRLAGCDLVLTGEGRLDAQSLRGKVCSGVARAAAEAGVPVHAIAGQVVAADKPTLETVFAACWSLAEGDAAGEATRDAAPRIERRTAEAVRRWRAAVSDP